MAAAMRSQKLRPYQRTAIESARRALTKSGSCILQMPTGAGKTRSATEIVAHSRGVIWFVCHRQEVERQVAKAFTAAGIDFGVVSPRGEFQSKKRVQIVSVHTLPKRIKKLPLPKLVIWDECHHVAAKSWASIRAKLKDARHLGLTATPERLDGKGLGEWFAELVTGPGISELIKRGYLSEFRYFAPSDPDLTNAKLQAGDYKKADLGRVMNTPVLIGDAVREYKKNAKGKRALAFCASVEASLALAARFNAERIAAAHVDGATPTADRERLVEELAAGRIKVLCNVEVFTEGFDLPAIDAVILMRPTKSPTLLLQMIGRGLRKAKGKDVAIIMDHAGLHRDHAWFADDWHWSLDGGAAKARRAAVARGPRRCPECKEVRAERVEVCACGYEFPTGREIGEFDGVLTEVRGVVPDGCVPVMEFAQLVGVSKNMPRNWIGLGLPQVNGFIPVSTGMEWVMKNIRVNARVRQDGCLKKHEFANRHGVSVSTVTAWIGRGCPEKNGNVPTELGDEWVSENTARSPDGFVTRQEFSRLAGVSHSTVSKWMSLGMPSNGTFVNKERGLLWARKSGNIDAGFKFKKVDKNDDSISMSSFAKKIGTSTGTVKALVGAGMPAASNGWPLVGRAMKWLKRNYTSRVIRPFDVDDHWNYESPIAFEARSRLRRGSSYEYRKRGLPCASNGWVHIQRGLEWVRDNTNIKIPASAWPKKAARVKRKPDDDNRLAA